MDEQLYLLGLGLSLDEKIKRAIATFQLYEKEALRRDPANGYYLCDSYGKDSGVILHLAKASGVKFVAHHNLTTLDPPELIYHGRKHHHETFMHRPKMAMLTRLTTVKGPPTRFVRWCCEEYKERGHDDKVKVFGVRAAESARRRANWKIWQPHRSSKHDGWVLNPILYWSDDNVWQYTRKNSIPYCCLYDEGFTRLGCIGCPMAGDGRKREFARWPKFETAWKRAFSIYWDKWHGVLREDGEQRFYDKKGFKCWQDLWSWWMEEMPKEDKGDECQMGLF